MLGLGINLIVCQAAMINNGRQFCGGSVVDSKHILTAAHCVYQYVVLVDLLHLLAAVNVEST